MLQRKNFSDLKIGIILFSFLFCTYFLANGQENLTNTVDSTSLKIYLSDGFKNSRISLEINGKTVLNNVVLNSSPNYGLTGQEIIIPRNKKSCNRIIVKTSQGTFKLKSKRKMILKLYSELPEFEYIIDEGKKFFVIYRRGDEYYVSTFTAQPGFD